MVLIKSNGNLLKSLNILTNHHRFSSLTSNKSINENAIPDTEISRENFIETIFKNILLETKDFFVLDKPVGVSLYRSLPLANLKYNGYSSQFTITDILPDLCAKLGIENSLSISSELPWNVSGLCVISKTAKHSKIADDFYRSTSYGQREVFAGQSYRCLCWNIPRKPTTPVHRFRYSYYQPDDNDFLYTISYKCDENHKLKDRKSWTKMIGHDLVSVGSRKDDNVALVDVKCNSSYRGLVPLYLLHQGCIVIGECIQSSRLVMGGINKDLFILPPEKANGAKLLPLQLRQRMGPLGRNMKQLPLHIHCHQLLIPSTKVSKKNMSYLTCGDRYNFNGNESVIINWDSKLKLNVCTYKSLPNYYTEMMRQLEIDLPFDEI